MLFTLFVVTEVTSVWMYVVQIETGVAITKQSLSFNGSELHSGSIAACGLKEESIVTLTEKVGKRERDICIADIAGDTSPDEYLRLVKEHPHLLRQYMNADAEFGSVLESGDVANVRKFIMGRYLSRHKASHDQQQELRKIDTDPTNADNQKKIEEMIRLKNIQVRALHCYILASLVLFEITLLCTHRTDCYRIIWNLQWRVFLKHLDVLLCCM